MYEPSMEINENFCVEDTQFNNGLTIVGKKLVKFSLYRGTVS